jgi:hypothetical protein
MRGWILLLCFLATGVSAAPLPGEEWHYADILSLIESRARAGRPLSTLDSLIAAFPAGMRRYFTFVYETHNRFQDASAANPRAVVFNQNLVYTFNGDPAQRGHGLLEVMEFDEASRRLELREITETADGLQAGTATPHTCLECHGSDPKPIWSGYARWPGLFGSDDDIPSGDELRNYLAFRSAIASAPASRYAQLAFAGGDVAPYRSREDDSYADRPNLALTKLLVRFNALRAAARLERSDYGAALRWFLPIEIGNWVDAAACELPATVQNGLDDAIRKALAAGIPVRPGAFGPERFLTALGMPVPAISPDPGAAGYLFGDGAGEMMTRLRDAILIDYAKTDAGLAASLQVSTSSYAGSKRTAPSTDVSMR